MAKATKWYAGGGVLVVLAIIGACAGTESAPAAGPAQVSGAQLPAASARQHQVILEATAGDRANVSGNVGMTGKLARVVDAGQTIRQEFRSDVLSLLSLSVGDVTADVGGAPNSCKITVDGAVIVEQSNALVAVCTG